jgi:hypothetical protein
MISRSFTITTNIHFVVEHLQLDHIFESPHFILFMAFASISILSFDIRSSHLSASLPLLINKWPRGWLLVLRYIQTWVAISNIWSGCKCSTTKCILVVIVKLRDIIMIYLYQIWHLTFCRDNFLWRCSNGIDIP